MKTGETWKDWTIESVIGEGSFGKVYKVVRHEFGHTYESALKIIRIPQSMAEESAIRSESVSDDRVREYFRSVMEDVVGEITMMSELRGSSNIVSYEDHSVEEIPDAFGWNICIRMELLTPLAEHINEKGFCIRDVVKIGIDICRALEVCRQNSIIHRDIKPENIFCSKLGYYKLGDFGIARQMEKTSTAMSKKGTFSYIAPEVYKGEPYDATVDIYSLGLVLYRFLNNNRPVFLPPFPDAIHYSDKEAALTRRMQGEALPAPCNAGERLSQIIVKACAYEPKDRYESPQAMRQDLESILETESDQLLDRPAIPIRTREETSDSFVDTEPVSLVFNTVVADHKEKKEEQEEQEHHEVQEDREYHEDQEHHEPHEDEPAKAGEAGIFHRPGPWILIAACIAVLCLGIGGYRYYHHEVPQIVGETTTSAEDSLKEAGLVYEETGREFSDDIDRNCIKSQAVQPGEKVKKGTTIQVVVSRGAAIKAPDLKGKSKKKAKTELEKKKLSLAVGKKKYSDTVKKGAVISQKPKAGTECEEGTVITVVLSKGIEQVKVPDVIGMSQEDAVAAIEKAKLQANVVSEYSSSVASGNICAQSVEANEKIDKNSTVTISVSIGARPTYHSSGGSSKKKSSGGGKKKSNDGWADM